MRKVQGFLALALVVAMSFSMAVPAFATEPDTIEWQEPVMEEAAYSDQGLLRSSQQVFIVGDDYVQIAYALTGINSEIYVAIVEDGYNGWAYQMNIRMLDSNGNIVWSADNATGVAADGHWWAGSNVTKVILQIAPRTWFSPARHFRVGVTY